MRKILCMICILVVFSTLSVGCSEKKSPVDNSTPVSPSQESNSENTAKTDSVAKTTYDNIQTVSVPDDYPDDKFPLSKDSKDKVIKVYEGSEGGLFDLKIVSTRGAKEIINEFAQLWTLENENTIFNDDLGVATLMGNAHGYEVIVNGSEQQPEKPEGAKTYYAVLVEKKK